MGKRKRVASATDENVGVTYKETHPPKLDSVAASIWGEVRDNAHSLNSGRFTKLIKDALINQDKAYTRCLEHHVQASQEATSKHRSLSRRANKAERRVAELEAELERLQGERDALKTRLEEATK